jgi:hypothetical protein
MSSDSPEQCAGVSDDSARLACYDRIFRKPDPPTGANSAAAPGPAAASARTGVAGTSSAATTAAVSTPQDDFGLSEAAKRARDPETAKEQMPESLTGKVASVGRRPTGELVVTLENGQVWAQIQTDTKARVNAGDTVTIKKAALGSYLLVTPGKLATRVRRVK